MPPKPKTFPFGPWPLPPSEIFLTTPHSLALVNLKPLVPGHVLLIPRRVVPRFQDLNPTEVSDLFTSVQKVGSVVEREFGGSSLTISIQDGVEAGQTVPHVHVHILPRKKGDWEKNDEVYDALEQSEKELRDGLEGRKKRLIVEDHLRKDRTMEEMEKEAKWLRGFFEQTEDIWS
ncbi:hypothetical protein HDV05_002356 [Chytridiales sp. JEL 0842]|nr:hypothetical protein HDV05_002356 [Chytridiales sp. JEL 0842]